MSPERVHHQTGSRCERHCRIKAAAIKHGRHARAAAQVSEDDTPVHYLRARETSEFTGQQGVRQTVKAIAPDALCIVSARNWQQARHARQVVVKSRIEASDLRHVG